MCREIAGLQDASSIRMACVSGYLLASRPRGTVSRASNRSAESHRTVVAARANGERSTAEQEREMVSQLLRFGYSLHWLHTGGDATYWEVRS